MTCLLAHVAQEAFDQFPEADTLTVTQDRNGDILTVRVAHGDRAFERAVTARALVNCRFGVAWFLEDMRHEWDRSVSRGRDELGPAPGRFVREHHSRYPQWKVDLFRAGIAERRQSGRPEDSG